MSDTELRRILTEVIEDLDTGRVILPRPVRPGIRALLAGPALAAGMALTGCLGGPVYGAPSTDARIVDAALDGGGVDAMYAAPWDAHVDAAPGPDAAPDSRVDDGGAPEYAVITDGGARDAAVDGGGVPLYMGPPPSA